MCVTKRDLLLFFLCHGSCVEELKKEAGATESQFNFLHRCIVVFYSGFAKTGVCEKTIYTKGLFHYEHNHLFLILPKTQLLSSTVTHALSIHALVKGEENEGDIVLRITMKPCGVFSFFLPS
uniref:T. congolense-specific, cell surface-expressed gene family n=1 Tax=Trypanosoma congolense (strain IL3000) TaxID=1068625 RepID=G0UQ76_TRYCI|nr:hypothetical protein, unlikely [Trypanosoma congolense IL3000]